MQTHTSTKERILVAGFIVFLFSIFFLFREYPHFGRVEGEYASRARQILTAADNYDLNSLLVIYKDNPEPILVKLDPLETELKVYSKTLDSERGFLLEAQKDRLELRLAEILADPNVEHVQPQFIYTTSTWTRSSDTDTPNDFDQTPTPATGNHWYYDLAGLRQLWQDQDCATSSESPCGGDSDVIIAVIDTGLAYETRTSAWGYNFAKNDDMFAASNINLYTNPGEIPNDRIDNDGNGYRDDYHGFNADNYVFCFPVEEVVCTNAEWAEDGHPNDNNGHGTYVTGLITSLVDNNFGSISAAHNISIMPIKASSTRVLGNSDTFSTASLIQAIDYAVDNGADVINMSLGGCSFDQALSDKLDWAKSQNVFIVASSGNGTCASPDQFDVQYPAAYASTLAVGAINANNTKSNYSSYGPELDVVAYVGDGNSEGTATFQRSFSCFFTNPNCADQISPDLTVLSNGYGTGTSFAAPQVSALAGILRSVGPELPATDIQSYIQNNATDIPGYGAGKDDETGYGVINFEATYNSLLNNQAPTITVTQPDGTDDTADSIYAILWTDDDPDNDAIIDIYWDNNAVGEDGTLITGCEGISEDDPTDQCDFDMSLLPNGTYYIYACIRDYVNGPVCSYGSGPITLVNSIVRDWNKTLVNTTYKQVNFDTSFNTPPVVIAQISSEFGRQKVFVNVKNVTTNGFEVAIEENTAAGWDGGHAVEEISWYAVQGSNAEEQVGRIDADHNWTTVNFIQPFVSTPHVLVTAQVQNGSQLDYPDIRNVTTNSFEVRTEEPAGLDGNHIPETIGWVAFLDNTEGQEGQAATNHNWSTVTFSSAFTSFPVLLAEIQTETGGAPANVDINSPTNSGFDFLIEEDILQDDGKHTTETISYLALPYTPPDRLSGTFDTTHKWGNLNFDKPFSDYPLVFFDTITENGAATVKTDARRVVRKGLKIRVEEDKSAGWDGNHVTETIAWLALYNPGAGEQAGTEFINHQWTTVNFPSSFTGIPKVFADIQSENEKTPAWIDIRNVTSTSFQMRVEEEKKAGWDGIHVNERVVWYAFEVPEVGQSGLVQTDHNWASVNFPIAFSSVPKLITNINSETGGAPAQSDIRNVTTTGFEVRVEEEKVQDGKHSVEDIVWYAWE